MQATQVHLETTGGPEVLRLRQVDLAAPGPGEILVQHEAIGLNFIDTYHRNGLYPVELPAPLGVEAAGTVIAAGDGVTHLAAGDRVGTFGPLRGAYASVRLAPASSYFRLPADVDCRTAAAMLLKGCTVEFLAERAAHPQAGDWVLLHAAAGGVGQLLAQWLTALGVRVIGTVGNVAKEAVARAAGCEIVLPADTPDLAEQVRAASGGGVRVVYDGVGAATWQVSLASCARRGLIVSFGNASGPVSGVNLGVLAAHGSLFVTRPTIYDYYVTPEDRAAGLDRLWAMWRQGAVKTTIGQTFPLTDVAAAHRALEARETTGSTLLLP
ncbi:MAG: quinone oxidoreductase [Novosphingobium sp.]